jgi:hypothetical protein
MLRAIFDHEVPPAPATSRNWTPAWFNITAAFGERPKPTSLTKTGTLRLRQMTAVFYNQILIIQVFKSLQYFLQNILDGDPNTSNGFSLSINLGLIGSIAYSSVTARKFLQL